MHVELRVVMAVISISAAILSYRILQVLRVQGEDTLATIHFDDAATVRDFLALAVGSVLLFFGFAGYLYGGQTGRHVYRSIGQTLLITYFLIPTMLLWRWRRRII